MRPPLLRLMDQRCGLLIAATIVITVEMRMIAKAMMSLSRAVNQKCGHLTLKKCLY
ncbi:hypothetical protein BCR43DRAFT_484127 [Syncephalastrum racemosum]|uniref:Uncharacterized protein n=1 Tax=Syncephalastrum racemosum TaxID=13706 RepID=A0A1X2HW99_SYNRA|nr:hypothetical protein BCR43DRAFT_484127 [Syncephalastrum racemosum]